MRRTLSELLQFGGVGLVATGTHGAIYLVALLLVAPQVANLMGFAMALLVSYLGHSRFTFADSNKGNSKNQRRVVRFGFVSGFGLAVNSGFVALTTHVLQAPPWVAVGFIAFVTPVMTYILLKFWVFGAK